MDLSELSRSLINIEDDEFGLNRILINLILQIFIKNNITDPNDIMCSIAQYLELNMDNPIILTIANKLNIIWNGNNWVWVE